MVNRMRANRSHRNNRRSHHALDEARVSTDKESGVTHLRHRASLVTGTYRGRKVLDVTPKLKEDKASK